MLLHVQVRRLFQTLAAISVHDFHGIATASSLLGRGIDRGKGAPAKATNIHMIVPKMRSKNAKNRPIFWRKLVLQTIGFYRYHIFQQIHTYKKHLNLLAVTNKTNHDQQISPGYVDVSAVSDPTCPAIRQCQTPCLFF